MAARLYTNGWDFFAPTQAVVYHLWSREYRHTFTEDLLKPRVMPQREASQARVSHVQASTDPPVCSALFSCWCCLCAHLLSHIDACIVLLRCCSPSAVLIWLSHVDACPVLSYCPHTTALSLHSRCCPLIAAGFLISVYGLDTEVAQHRRGSHYVRSWQ